MQKEVNAVYILLLPSVRREVASTHCNRMLQYSYSCELLRDVAAVCCEVHTRRCNNLTLCWQSAEILMARQMVDIAQGSLK
jgi:hypothetical protein